MNWHDLFAEKNNVGGSNLAEEFKTQLEEEFIDYFEHRKTVGKVDEVNQEFVIQNIKYGENVGDEKLLLAKEGTSIDEGSIVEFKNTQWIVINQENRPDQNHLVFKIRLLNNQMSYKYKDGIVYTFKCSTVGKNSFANYKQTEATLTDNRMLVYVKANGVTDKIQQNFRFIFNNRWAYSVIDVDGITSQKQKIYIITMERTLINHETDDLTNNIAYMEWDNNAVDTINGVSFNTKELEVFYGMTDTAEIYNYVNSVSQSDTFTFRIDNIPVDKYKIVNTTGNTITIKAVKYGYSGTLVGIDSSNNEYSIPLRLSGF